MLVIIRFPAPVSVPQRSGWDPVICIFNEIRLNLRAPLGNNKVLDKPSSYGDLVSETGINETSFYLQPRKIFNGDIKELVPPFSCPAIRNLPWQKTLNANYCL